MIQHVTYGLHLRSGREQATVRRASGTAVTRSYTKPPEKHAALTERLVGLALVATTTLFGSELLWSLSRALESYRVF